MSDFNCRQSIMNDRKINGKQSQYPPIFSDNTCFFKDSLSENNLLAHIEAIKQESSSDDDLENECPN